MLSTTCLGPRGRDFSIRSHRLCSSAETVYTCIITTIINRYAPMALPTPSLSCCSRAMAAKSTATTANIRKLRDSSNKSLRIKPNMKALPFQHSCFS